jgi:hypothetical protein
MPGARPTGRSSPRSTRAHGSGEIFDELHLVTLDELPDVQEALGALRRELAGAYKPAPEVYRTAGRLRWSTAQAQPRTRAPTPTNRPPTSWTWPNAWASDAAGQGDRPGLCSGFSWTKLAFDGCRV